jgi:hypothetical protein
VRVHQGKAVSDLQSVLPGRGTPQCRGTQLFIAQQTQHFGLLGAQDEVGTGQHSLSQHRLPYVCEWVVAQHVESVAHARLVAVAPGPIPATDEEPGVRAKESSRVGSISRGSPVRVLRRLWPW